MAKTNRATPGEYTPNAAAGDKPITPTADRGVVGLDDFVGHWAAVEVEPGDNADVLVLYREGENIVADIEGDRLELSDLNGRVLSGYLWSPYEDLPTPVSAALNEDKQQVTFTVSPPQSEPMVAVARRVQAEVPIAPVATPISQVITGAIAIEQVTNLPDVAAWQEMVRVNAPQNTTHIVLVEERPTSYLIHVFETVNNSGESSHTSTYNWYEVDRQTGEISPMFYVKRIPRIAGCLT
ncbi:hypothetical protein [Picosynechococcus sp. NKBG15041c]|uniref:hypothetical protein n=1 Tax=Picosynechococcus sp. NKBG15041c TaxID=1407650 RepID=UPI000465DF9B|nr:hypothetical protein [Picosynechococcus sp. NKBG15041c]